MKNLSTAIATVIVTYFLMKIYRKFKQKPEDSKKELHETLIREKIAADRRRAYEEQKRQREGRRLAGSEPMAPGDRDLAWSRYYGDIAAPKGCAIGTCNR